MPVPDYEAIMRPLLMLISDGREHSMREAEDALAVEFRLTDADRAELLPSGTEPKFDNRVRFAKMYLKKAGLLQSTARGRFRITEGGREALTSKATVIDRNIVKQNSEHQSRTGSSKPSGEIEHPHVTPEETLEASYQTLRADLAQELLERMKRCSPRFFEKLVVDLLVAMGYGGSRKDAGQAVGQSGDGGIDGIIKEDKLGLDVVYIQAKRWEAGVGRPVVQGFAGSLEGQRARKGVLITTSQFSQDAMDYVSHIEKKIVLIDGQQLAQLMIDHGVGVAEVSTYTVKKVDVDYFEDEQ